MELPIKPDPSDCCNSGCTPCILDVYEEQLKKFHNLTLVQRSTKNCLSKTSYSVFKLVSVEKHSKDINIYSFEYLRPQKPDKYLDYDKDIAVIYEPGQHLLLKVSVNNESFTRAYTPIFVENQPKDRFTIVVKLYEHGKMSKYFRKIQINDNTLWRGPYGDFRLNFEEKNMFFIAQGTGIAPFYSIFCDMLNNEKCYTFITLFFCCNAENLMLRDELYGLSKFWNFRYELFISGIKSDNVKKKYNETVHFAKMKQQDIQTFLNGANEEVNILICGNKNFGKNVKNDLMECGVPIVRIIMF